MKQAHLYYVAAALALTAAAVSYAGNPELSFHVVFVALMAVILAWLGIRESRKPNAGG
jgi:hypothetical protein